MSSLPAVTMLLSVYKNDQPVALDECLGSIYDQTIQPEEVLVVQEGPVSEAVEAVLDKWIAAFGTKFSLIKVPPQKGPLNFGLPASLNIGIGLAKYEYIMRMDTDDICTANRVDSQKKFAQEHPQVDLFGCHIEEFDETFSTKTGERKVPLTHASIVKMATWKNPFNGPTVVFKKSVAIELGGFPIVASNEDYCFWGLFVKAKRIMANQDEYLVKMRGGDQIVVRRSSRRYQKGEVMALKYLREIGILSTYQYYVHLIGKLVIRNLPFKAVKRIYSSFLRQSS